MKCKFHNRGGEGQKMSAATIMLLSKKLLPIMSLGTLYVELSPSQASAIVTTLSTVNEMITCLDITCRLCSFLLDLSWAVTVFGVSFSLEQEIEFQMVIRHEIWLHTNTRHIGRGKNLIYVRDCTLLFSSPARIVLLCNWEMVISSASGTTTPCMPRQGVETHNSVELYCGGLHVC